jgi:ketosteroid isomerase-like protein
MKQRARQLGSIAINYDPPTEEQIAAAADWVIRFAEHWRSPKPDVLRDLMQPQTRNLIPPMKAPADREGVVAHFRQLLERAPDLSLEVLRWAPVGDTVMVEWEAKATFSGKPLTWRGVDRVSLSDGKTYEGQVYWDTRGLAEAIAEAESI